MRAQVALAGCNAALPVNWRRTAGVCGNLPGCLARVIFCPHHGSIAALHGFIKKTLKTPQADRDLAKDRMKEEARS